MGDEVRVIEKCGVEPPPGSLPSPTTLPLTFFDILWLHSLPIKRIFFFHFPHPTNHFLQTTLPTLKHSLSLTLQHFFPFASNLIVPPNSHPYIRYLHGNSLPFTVAESPADFHLLVSDSQDASNWLPLVPTLSPPRTENDGTRVVPLMSIQLTLLPNSGFSISFTFHHVASDGKSLHHFIKHWASLFKANGNILELPITTTLPSHERDKVKDPKDLKLIYLQELPPPPRDSVSDVHQVSANINKLVRATIALSREQVEKLKKWITMALTCNGYKPHVSTFVVTCSLIWVCMLKSKERKLDDEKLSYFIFGADCRDHPQLSIPSNYFGNCLAGRMVSAKMNELVGTTNNNGMVVAANAIERNVKDFKNDALNGAETLMSRVREMRQSNTIVVAVSGSPKLGVYNTDFGWGKPIKTDSVHLDRLGHISLSDCRDNEGGIEATTPNHSKPYCITSCQQVESANIGIGDRSLVHVQLPSLVNCHHQPTKIILFYMLQKLHFITNAQVAQYLKLLIFQLSNKLLKFKLQTKACLTFILGRERVRNVFEPFEEHRRA